MKFTDNGSTQRAFTKDGYLVVPATLSRLGVFDYANSEVGKQGAGIARVARTEKSLFSDDTIKSFENAPITLGHPEEDVNATNWKQLAVGTMRNVKREGDHLVGEAWVNDEATIKVIHEKGIDELSCGYTCDLLDGKQAGADFEMSPMIGNHVAIVANGRCGGSCKLADQQKGNVTMSKNRNFLDRLLSGFGIKLTDEQAKQVEDEEKKEKPKEEDEGKEPEAKSEGEKSETKTKPDEKSDDEEKEKEKKTMADQALLDKIAKLEAENKQLKDAKAETEKVNAVATTLADAKTHFGSVQFADGATVRQIQEQAVISTGIFAKDELAKLSDAEVAGAYQAAKATAKKLNDRNLGAGFLNVKDHQNTTFDFNSYNEKGGK